MVLRPWSATVMLETVPGILALLGRTAPRRPQRFSKPPPCRTFLRLKSECDKLGYSEQMSTRVDSTPAWQAGALHQVLRSLQAKLIGIQELGSTRCLLQ